VLKWRGGEALTNENGAPGGKTRGGSAVINPEHGKKIDFSRLQGKRGGILEMKCPAALQDSQAMLKTRLNNQAEDCFLVTRSQG